ncbi:MAG TPA: carbohydrate ABC transporter permease [Spirochaetia bacterium]|nr:carbohydrate ABC transporter permease [Spirochaetia bacterium]
MRCRDLRAKLGKLPPRVMIVLIILIVIYPIFFVIQTSFKTDEEILSNFWGLPQAPTLTNYADAWVKASIGTYFMNSSIVVVTSTVAIVYVAILAAYALARLKVRHANLIIGVLLFTMFLPGEMNVLPMSIMFSKASLMRRYITLILPYVAWQLPLSTFICYNYLLTLPVDLIEAARIDGRREIGILNRVIIPLASPPIACVTIVMFCILWGEYLWAAITMQGGGPRTLPLGLQKFSAYQRIAWGPYTAAVALVIVPLIALFVAMQNKFVQGLTSGAVKG